jgi:N-acetyl sugar amidotransferase
MESKVSENTDRTRYSLSEQHLEVLYGLPREVKFCTKCNMSNQQPMSANEYSHSSSSAKETMEFDSEGVCRACRFNELKHDGTIDWELRERELIELCAQYRKSDGSYDCIVGGSGGKDSAMQSHLLKYRYGMNPLTVTWAPHLHTAIGWKNFQNWIHKGGFDNFLFTPNGKTHRLLTREATLNLLHPFQPFILGQKTFVAKMAAQFNIPLIFYGEMPGEYGERISHTTSSFSDQYESESQGFRLDYADGREQRDLLLGGVSVGELIDRGVPLVDLMPYLPIQEGVLSEKGIEFKYLGYYINWVPQEAYYFAVEHTGFTANPQRTEGTYSKYNSLDDKVDGFFYYTRWIKFGVGRAMMDSAQEIRNGHIDTAEGQALIAKFDGEYPALYEKDFLEYIQLDKEDFACLCDKFRSPHLWKIVDDQWRLRVSPGQIVESQHRAIGA